MKRLGFSLIELLISLIIISIIAAVFLPVLTKRLKYREIAFGGNNVSVNCSLFDSENRCSMCTQNYCTLCVTEQSVPRGYYVNPKESCDYQLCEEKFEGCTECNKDFCLACKDRYAYSKEQKTCIKCPEVCLTCDSKGSCLSCFERYALNEELKTCIKCPDNCLSCNSNGVCDECEYGYNIADGMCVSICPQGSLLSGNLCVQKFNAGDSGGLSIPGGISIKPLVNNTEDAPGKHYNLYCWRGRTSQSCDSKGGDYSGCNRTVCTWTAADKICKTHGWRLPNMSELGRILKDKQLQFCDRSPLGSNSLCAISKKCPGSNDGNCVASDVWSSERPNNYSTYFLNKNSLNKHESYSSNAYTVRCVKGI